MYPYVYKVQVYPFDKPRRFRALVQGLKAAEIARLHFALALWLRVHSTCLYMGTCTHTYVHICKNAFDKYIFATDKSHFIRQSQRQTESAAEREQAGGGGGGE